MTELQTLNDLNPSGIVLATVKCDQGADPVIAGDLGSSDLIGSDLRSTVNHGNVAVLIQNNKLNLLYVIALIGDIAGGEISAVEISGQSHLIHGVLGSVIAVSGNVNTLDLGDCSGDSRLGSQSDSVDVGLGAILGNDRNGSAVVIVEAVRTVGDGDNRVVIVSLGGNLGSSAEVTSHSSGERGSSLLELNSNAVDVNGSSSLVAELLTNIDAGSGRGSLVVVDDPDALGLNVLGLEVSDRTDSTVSKDDLGVGIVEIVGLVRGDDTLAAQLSTAVT